MKGERVFLVDNRFEMLPEVKERAAIIQEGTVLVTPGNIFLAHFEFFKFDPIECKLQALSWAKSRIEEELEELKNAIANPT